MEEIDYREFNNQVIVNLIRLCGMAYDLPVFRFTYIVEGPNDELEENVSKNVDEYDWNGNRFSDEEIEKDRAKAIEAFHNSDGYNRFSGISTIKMSVTWTRQSLSFDNVRHLMEHPGVGKFVRLIGLE